MLTSGRCQEEAGTLEVDPKYLILETDAISHTVCKVCTKNGLSLKQTTNHGLVHSVL